MQIARPLRPAVALTVTLLAACDGGSSPTQSEPEATPRVAALQVLGPATAEGIANVRLPDSVTVRAVTEQGTGVRGIQIRFAAASGNGSLSPTVAATDSLGYARSAWTLGAGAEQQATASIPNFPAAVLHARAMQVSAGVANMAGQLDQFIRSQLQQLEADAPKNPLSTAFFDAKIAMLKNPGLAGDVLRDRRWVEVLAQSTNGRPIPVTAMFALDTMRTETQELASEIASTLPVLEGFMQTPYPYSSTTVWNGFRIGSYSAIAIEDRGSFQARTRGANGPYEAVAHHELGHHWMGHESLNQVLELYGWNVVHGYGTDPRQWGFTRNWVPMSSTNTGVQALLDVYVLVGGRDAMSRIYKAVFAMKPAYGQPLPDAVRQLFVEQSPDSVKAQVAAKMARVEY